MQSNIFTLPFDFNEAKKSNILLTGTNHTGKSRLAAGLCSILQTLNWKIIAFDNAGIWKRISDIPIYVDVEPSEYFYQIPIVNKSIIYDISQLIPERQKIFVDYVLRDAWENRESQNYQWLLIMFEEAQLYLRNIRGNVSQNIMRIASAGRNRQIRVLAITVDLSLLDPAFIRLCQQRYHAKLGIEENAKRKYRNYYGKEWLNTTINLELGQFVYLNKNKLEKIRVPLFQSKRQPISYTEYLDSLTPKIEQKPSLLQRIKGLWK